MYIKLLYKNVNITILNSFIYKRVFFNDLYKEGIPQQDFPALVGNIVTLKPFLSSCNGIPLTVIIFQTSCRKVRGFHTKIVVNLSSHHNIK